MTTDRFGNANKAYSFDGDDWIEVPNSSSLNSPALNKTLTISSWVKINQWSGVIAQDLGIILSKSFSGNSTCEFFSAISSHGGLYGAGTYNFSLNQWYHIVQTAEKVNNDLIVKSYVNGQFVGSTTNDNYLLGVSYFTPQTNNLHIGRDPLGYTEYCKGTIDDIRIYNRVLSNVEVTQLYNAVSPPVTLQTGLIAHYPFNGNANDESGNANNPTTNSATLTTDRCGNANKAYSFDGDDYIQIPYNRALLPNNDTKTYSCWLKFSNNHAGNTFYFQNGNADFSDGQFKFEINNQGRMNVQLHSYWGYGGGSNANYMYHDIPNFNPLTYHLLAISIDNSIVKYYLDGQLIVTKSWNLAYKPFDQNYQIEIGRHFNSYGGGYINSFNGSIDDFSIYNRLLSDAEIQQLYNTGGNITITSVTPQSATCGNSNGTLTVVAVGTGLQYSLNNGAYQASNVFNNLAAGSYIVSIKDTANCPINAPAITIQNINCVALRAKVLLEAGYNINTGLMDDYFSDNNQLPLLEPFTNLGFTHVGGGGGEMTTASVISAASAIRVVDWIFVELRDTTSPSVVLATRSGLLLTDGNIVDVDGVEPLKFKSMKLRNYHVAIRHRNHLGFRMLNKVLLETSQATILDFRNLSIPINGSTPLKLLAPNIRGMNSGDANSDGSIDAFDTLIWEAQNGLFDDYTLNADYNMDGSADAFDTLIWELNNGRFEELD